MITVKDILASKVRANNFIEPTALVVDALKLLHSVNRSYLIVQENETFVGIFSERDYTRRVFLEGRSSTDTRVQEVMATDLPHVDLAATVEDCMNLMTNHGSRYVLAFDNREEFAGVITSHDLMRQIIAIISNKEGLFDKSLASAFIDKDESGLIY
ncbi:CBS domain-containing protein [Paraflavisolibacter sp. H34]|uniref:CBS domain-containing protein n=1 Tax=Huijunlia imazamoxiresistens TaxID=3127457 RepID=UPI003015C6CF